MSERGKILPPPETARPQPLPEHSPKLPVPELLHADEKTPDELRVPEALLADETLFERMVPADRKESFFAATSPEERTSFLQAFVALPETYHQRFAERIATAAKSRDEASVITSLRGAIFEMTRILTVIEQGLESVLLDGKPPAVTLDFRGYDKKTVDFSESPARIVKGSEIDFDIPITRKGKPYAYDAKSYPRKAFGSADPAHTRNQLLKYEAAVNQELIAGATIEIRGRLSRDMLLWASGGSMDDPGAIPNVEIVYTHPLPSGKEYRFVLKRSKKNNGLQFRNEDRLSDEDMKVVRGIQMSLADKSIVSLIADVPIHATEASDALQPFLANPEAITTRALFEEFDRLRTEAITRKLKEKSELGRINFENKKSALSPEANPAFIEASIREMQDYLAHNPKIAAAKKHYIVTPDRIPEAVTRVMQAIDLVARRERALLDDPEEALRATKRYTMGYLGRPEGISLDIEHFIVDALYGMNKPGFEASRVQKVAGKNADLFFKKEGEYYRGIFNTPEEFDTAVAQSKDLQRALRTLSNSQRDEIRRMVKESTFVRSYDWPERFLEAADIGKALEGQDRRYRELRIFDAKTGQIERQTDTNDEKIADAEYAIIRENIERSRAYIQQVKESNVHRGQKMELQQRKAITGAERNIAILKTEQEAQTAILQRAAQIRMKAINEAFSALKRERDQLTKELRKSETDARRQAEIALRSEEIETSIDTLNEERLAAFAPMRSLSAEYLLRIREQERHIEQAYRKIIPADEWKTFEKRVVETIDQNILKMIYTVQPDGRVIVQEEVLRGDVTGRAAHSELNEGLNTYGAGELAFEKRDNAWVLVEINNGSGHYRPDAVSTLSYVRNLLAEKGIDVSQAALVDSILRGLELGRHLREASAF